MRVMKEGVEALGDQKKRLVITFNHILFIFLSGELSTVQDIGKMLLKIMRII